MAVYGNLSVGAGTRKVLGEGVQCIWVFFHLSVYVQLRRGRSDFLQHSLSFSQALIYCTFSGSLLNLCSCSDSSWPVYACLKVGEGKLCPQCAAGQTGTDSDTDSQSRGKAVHLPHLRSRGSMPSQLVPETVKDTQGIPPYSTVLVVRYPFS